ncbi:MAG: patatin-like phospholipase RssA [Candidatus Competibacteraceae bacterium]|nr:patatin-like phospholipase RssA [Candidatus Competibacteraceae bacterium]
MNAPDTAHSHRPRIGIALGSGAARGWAHIGILRALKEMGVEPEIVSGSSIGALVGAAYAAGRLQALEEWVSGFSRWGVLRLMDFGLGGMMEAERVMRAYAERVPDRAIESLKTTFGAVATDLASGREVWFTEGGLHEAVRASIAMPGLIKPLKVEGHWLVDGGLVDPVPVALCRALGADRVIAVNLNGDLLTRHHKIRPLRRGRSDGLMEQFTQHFQLLAGTGTRVEPDSPVGVRMLDVLTGAMNIMQDRITRSRMAGDPPDLILNPRLGDMALLAFDRGLEAIEAGENCVHLYRAALEDVLGLEPSSSEEEE